MHPDCLQAGDHSMRVVHLLKYTETVNLVQSHSMDMKSIIRRLEM